MKNNSKGFLGIGVLSAIGASLCCITPVLALISGTTGFASTFSWLEPFRPYLIGITVLILGFVWYQKLKPKNKIDCDCETDEKPKFTQSKTFLGLITGFAILMLVFPYYGKIFYPKTEKEIIVIDRSNIKTLTIEIEGMTCNSCEEHVSHAVNQLNGVLKVDASFDNANAIVEFDKLKTTIEEIYKAINNTGYTVSEIKE